MARVIGAETVEETRRAGRQVLEILPGDIVTDLAAESAVRLGIRLVDGDHDIDCKVDGIGAMKLKSEFVKKA